MPQDFKEEIKKGILEFTKANNIVMDSFKSKLRKLAKGDEEKEFIENLIAETFDE